MLLDRALRTKGDVVCRLEGQILLLKETLLDADVMEAVHVSVSSHHIKGQHGRIVKHPGGQVRRSEGALRGQLSEYRGVGSNRLAWKLVPTLEQRAVVHLGQPRVELDRQGCHEFVI